MKAWCCVLAILLGLGGTADARGRRGAVTAPLSLDAPTRLGGLSIRIVFTGEKRTADGDGDVAAYGLTVRKGKRHVTVHSGWVSAPWFEAVAFGKLVQVGPGADGLAVTVAPSKGVRRRGLDEDAAFDRVSAEATRRGIDHDGGGTSGGGGVVFVTLSRGGDEVVQAVIGARSRDLLAFDVRPAAARPDAPSADAAAAAPDDVAAALLAEHDRYRADHCAPPLAWSERLAAVAQAWADHLRDAGCAFTHSRTAYGENLAAGTTGTLTPADVVAMWYREVDAYDFAAGGFSSETGHFTQVVWKDTTSIGCGVAHCDDLDLWVCNYDPPGNVDGEYRAEVLPTSCR